MGNTNSSTCINTNIQSNSQDQSEDIINSALNDPNPQPLATTTTSNTISSNSSSTQTKLARFRPSTIPRDYLCLLKGNQFKYYDFYKSKWDILNSWPPPQNPSSKKRTSVQSSDYCNNLFTNTGNNNNSSEALDNEDFNVNPCSNLGGYSTVLINNFLYVIGGYSLKSGSSFSSTSGSSSLRLGLDSQRIELMDQVWRYDPIKNEWTKCAPMLRKRAFQISISLETTDATNVSASTQPQQACSTKSSCKKNRYIFLLYGLCLASEGSGQPVELNAFPLKQCLAIDVYSLEADQWSKLKNNDSLLDHHVFQSINNQNRLILTGK